MRFSEEVLNWSLQFHGNFVSNQMLMQKSISIHIALNRVDKRAYSGREGVMSICESDARSLLRIAHFEGYQSKVALFGMAATRKRIEYELSLAAQVLKAGDQLLITFSGHGTTVYDINGDESDGFDEGICSWDGVILDDDIRLMLSKFEAGVRILMIADCCYSGDMFKGDSELFCSESDSIFGSAYKGRESNHSRNSVYSQKIQASCLLLAAAREDEQGRAKRKQSAFIEALVSLWAEQSYKGSYCQFSYELNEMVSGQTISLNKDECNDLNFLHSRPFQIIK